jgi:hypothetical protein
MPRLRPELKYLDVVELTQTISSTPSFYSLTGTNNTTTDVGRVGDRVAITNVQLKITALKADTTNIIRITLIQWFPDDSIDAPNLAAIYASSSAPWLSPFNHDNNKKFRVLYDKTCIMNVDMPQCYREVNAQRFPMRYLQYQAGSPNGNGMVYLALVSDSTASSHPSIDFTARFDFFDE